MAKPSRPQRDVPKADVSEADLVNRAFESLQTSAEVKPELATAAPIERLTSQDVKRVIDGRSFVWLLSVGGPTVLALGGLLAWLIGRTDDVEQRLRSAITEERQEIQESLNHIGNQFDRLDDRLRGLEIRDRPAPTGR